MSLTGSSQVVSDHPADRHAQLWHRLFCSPGNPQEQQEGDQLVAAAALPLLQVV